MTGLPERYPTVYDGWPLSEVVASRVMLLAAVADPRFSDHERNNFAGLLEAATVELADRLSMLIILNSPATFGLALESLAADCGITPAPPPRQNDSSLTTPKQSMVSEPFIVKQRGRQAPAWFDVVGGKVVMRQ